MSVHPIEQESYRILEERIDLTGLASLGRAVVARVAHATADLDLARSMVLDEAELEMAVRALRDGAPVVADVVMVAAGITGRRARSFLDQVPTGVPATSAATSGVAGVPATGAATSGLAGVPATSAVTSGVAGVPATRSAAAMRLAAAAHPSGAVFVVGCAPTALVELVDLAAAGAVEPALVIGVPVGFVGAAESKAALRASGLPAVSNVGERGGSAAAAAACNALIRAAAIGGDRG